MCVAADTDIHAKAKKITRSNIKRTEIHDTTAAARIFPPCNIRFQQLSGSRGHVRLPDSCVDSASLICLSWLAVTVSSSIHTTLSRHGVYIVTLNLCFTPFGSPLRYLFCFTHSLFLFILPFFSLFVVLISIYCYSFTSSTFIHSGICITTPNLFILSTLLAATSHSFFVIPHSHNTNSS